MHTRRILLIALLLAAGLSAGCEDLSKVSLQSEDRICRPGQTITVEAELTRSGWTKWFPPRDPPPIRIYHGNELVEEVKPVGADRVSTQVTLEETGEHAIDALYQIRPSSPPLQATCYAWCWDESRVAVAVDFDRVMNLVGQFDRYRSDAPLGEVRGEAAEVLGALARDFNICYLTELPVEAKEPIRTWLRSNRLPAGPVVTWRRGERFNPLDNGSMAAVLGRLRDDLPTLLLGIGGDDDSLRAFQTNGMLPVMLALDEKISAPGDVPVFDSWRGVWHFFSFEPNYPILTDPRVMLDLHTKGGEYLRFDTGRPSVYQAGEEPYIWTPPGYKHKSLEEHRQKSAEPYIWTPSDTPAE